MFGLKVNVVCPNCGGTYTEDLGCGTAYYKVDDSDIRYTECECHLCKKQYWLSHRFEEVIDVRKMNENEKLELVSIVCW